MTDEERGLDPSKPAQIAIFGKKGEGKTEIGFSFFNSYPYDRVLIDPNGDIKIEGEFIDLDPDNLPDRWPASALEKKKAKTLRFIPDTGRADFLADIDHVMGLAYRHGKTCLCVDEAHEAFPANRTQPHGRRILRQGRHRGLTSIMMTPRPKTIDPLVISNADWVYAYKTPNPGDRQRIAENIGWNPRDFDQAIYDLDKHEYLRYDSDESELLHFPPLPLDLIKHHKT